MEEETKTPASRLDALKARLAREKNERAAAEAAITREEREEIELRRNIALEEEARTKAELEKRELDLEQRLELARERFPAAKIVSLMIDEYPDSFLVRHSSAAFAKWEAQISAAASNKKIDKPAVSRNYAMDLVIDWNGLDLSEANSPGGELVEYLKRNQGIVTSIVNAGAGLAGAFSEARKS